MADYVLVCYPADPIKDRETVDMHMHGYETAWHALAAYAEMLSHMAGGAYTPVRIDILTHEEWRTGKREKGGTAEQDEPQWDWDHPLTLRPDSAGEE